MFEPFPKITRLKRDCVVTEKIDGTNAQVYICAPAAMPDPFPKPIAVADDLWIYAGSRNRLITPDNDNFEFAAWVQGNADELVKLGPGRHYGEWWGRGIQRGYGLNDRRFSLFNVNRWKGDQPACCSVVPVLYRGNFETSAFEQCIKDLMDFGSAAASDFMDPEGIVIFHGASRMLFKQTIKNDHIAKAEAA